MVLSLSRILVVAAAVAVEGAILFSAAPASAQQNVAPLAEDAGPPRTGDGDPRGADVDGEAPVAAPSAAPVDAAATAAPLPNAPSTASSVPPPAPPAVPSVAKAERKPEKKPVLAVSGRPGSGITLRAGEAFSVNVRSRFQLRYQWSAPAPEPGQDRDSTSLVNIGTARLWISGHAYRPELLYVIQLAVAGRDFRDGQTSPLFDAFLDWKAHRDISVRAGQYFVPFDRLRTVREFALQMAERPVPVGELTLDRDAGVTFYSDRFLGSPLAWRVGAFGGGGTNQVTSKEPGGLLVGRLEVRPLGEIDDDSEGDLARRRRPGLALGVAAAQNWNTNRLRSTTGPTFAGGTTDYRHMAADAVLKWRGVAVQAEYLRKTASADTIASTAADGAPVTEYTRSGHGWVVQASYTFDPPFEVVGRVSRLYTLRATDPKLVSEVDRRGQEVAAGVNYYLNGHALKLHADWIARLPPSFAFDRADHFVHVHLDATF